MPNHREAFALMWYGCETCAHRERIWNSRDGVTPFGIGCPSCGYTLHHVAWGLDEASPSHKLFKGQRYFRDGTPDEAEAIMRKRIASMIGTEYEVDNEHAAALIMGARNGGDDFSEFRKGWPMLAIHEG